MREFDREQEGRPPPLGKKKTPPEVSINQREVRGDRKRKRKTRSGRTERRAKRQTASKLSILPDSTSLTRSQDGTVCLQKFDAEFLVTVGITLDTW